MKNVQLAKRVKELRKRRGFSQEDLSEYSGLSHRTIQRVENSESQPTGETLKRIAQALNVTPNELMDWVIIEDQDYLIKLNLSSLTFLLFPVLGILIPFVIWVPKKDKIKDINKIGRDLINFQITWTITLFLIPIIFLVLIKTGIFRKATISTGLFFMLLMYIINIVFIMANTMRIYRGKDVKYFPKIRFLNR